MTLPDEPPRSDAAETANGAAGDSGAGAVGAGGGAAGDDGAAEGSQAGEGAAGEGSGLRDPQRAVRGLGALTLVLEAIVLLLAIPPLRMLQHGIAPVQLWVLLGAAVAAIVIAGRLGGASGWRLGTALQAALVLGGILHWTIGVIGVTFGLAWFYVLYVRHRVLS